MWWNRLFINIGLDVKHMNTMNYNNKQMVNLLSKAEPIFLTKLCHVNIHQHWLRELMQRNRINID
jgi:hypothetical protein